jgi:hypothetical protein
MQAQIRNLKPFGATVLSSRFMVYLISVRPILLLGIFAGDKRMTLLAQGLQLGGLICANIFR